VLELQREHESFATYLWGWVDGEPIVNHPHSTGELPARTPLSEALSKDLRRRSFTFVGPTIVYSFMQAVGMVDDHVVGCPAKRSS
jgi:DNA-3-methyladenine glycosylase I